MVGCGADYGLGRRVRISGSMRTRQQKEAAVATRRLFTRALALVLALILSLILGAPVATAQPPDPTDGARGLKAASLPAREGPAGPAEPNDLTTLFGVEWT
jgi:hypothetical protein